MLSDRETERRRIREWNQLARLVERHNGNRTAIARDLSRGGFTITRQGITNKLRRHGLLEAADMLSALAMKPGQRHHLDAEELVKERADLLAALVEADRYETAIRANGGPLGYSIPTLYRKIQAHKITREEVAAEKERARRRRG